MLGTTGNAFPGMFLRPFKKLAAHVLSGLKLNKTLLLVFLTLHNWLAIRTEVVALIMQHIAVEVQLGIITKYLFTYKKQSYNKLSSVAQKIMNLSNTYKHSFWSTAVREVQKRKKMRIQGKILKSQNNQTSDTQQQI